MRNRSPDRGQCCELDNALCKSLPVWRTRVLYDTIPRELPGTPYSCRPCDTFFSSSPIFCPSGARVFRLSRFCRTASPPGRAFPHVWQRPVRRRGGAPALPLRISLCARFFTGGRSGMPCVIRQVFCRRTVRAVVPMRVTCAMSHLDYVTEFYACLKNLQNMNYCFRENKICIISQV